MKSWLIVLIIIALPHLAFAASGETLHKKAKDHPKVGKKVAVHHRSKVKYRYKLVAYHNKNGVLRHKYVDTRPEKITPPPADLYPEAPPSLPQMETEFIPNHERAPASSENIGKVSLDESKDGFPAPEMH